jgi:hypothetical protein
MVISKKVLMIFGFKVIEDYFNYIVESQINGNHSQVKQLYKKMDDGQKETFYNWLKMMEIKFNYSGLF